MKRKGASSNQGVAPIDDEDDEMDMSDIEADKPDECEDVAKHDTKDAEGALQLWLTEEFTHDHSPSYLQQGMEYPMKLES